MEPITLKIQNKAIEVKPLVSYRAVAVVKVVSRGRCTWAVDSKGEVLCADIASIRGRRRHPWNGVDEFCLSDDDVFALGALGVIDAKMVAKIKDSKEFLADYHSRKNWLEADIKSVRDAGIKLPKDWRAQVERGVVAYAKKKQAARRKAAREKARLLKERNA